MKTVLFSFGNSLRRDDGIAAAVCSKLAPDTSGQICWFDLGGHIELLPQYIENAPPIIIVDAIKQQPVGKSTVIKLSSAERNRVVLPRSAHGLSWMDELALVQNDASVTLFGINVMDDGWGCGLSDEALKALPTLVEELASLCAGKETSDA